MTKTNNASIKLKYTNTFVAATPVSVEAMIWALGHRPYKDIGTILVVSLCVLQTHWDPLNL
jgi:hypothetical protein